MVQNKVCIVIIAGAISDRRCTLYNIEGIIFTPGMFYWYYTLNFLTVSLIQTVGANGSIQSHIFENGIIESNI
jgi:alanine-alpha-ketoisovalerate/valine-pyruvate aminotransferase